MRLLPLLCWLCLLPFVEGCFDDSSSAPPSYRWVAADVNWAMVYRDSIRPMEPCWVDYESGKDYGHCYYYFPEPREDIWNCTGKYMERRGDTVFLRAFAASGPDSSWRSTFECLDRYEAFVLQPDGRGVHVGPGKLDQDPELRLEGDTLRFRMTFTVFDRSKTSIAGPNTPGWVYYHDYGFQKNNLDSLQAYLGSYCAQQEYCLSDDYKAWQEQVNLLLKYCPTNRTCDNSEVPMDSVLAAASAPGCRSFNFCTHDLGVGAGPDNYMVAWREFLYVPSDSVLTR